MATRFYGLLWKWHFVLGLAACPLVAIVALTGAIYAFEPELKRWADADVMVVEPAGPLRPLDELVAAARTQCSVGSVWMPGPPDAAYAFYCKDDRTLFVDPYRGTVLGTPASATHAIIDFAFSLHWELALGETGRLLVEWASSCTILLLVTGAILWWPRGKRRTGGVLYPRTRLVGRQWLRDLHAVLGAYTLPVVFVVAATGLMWTIHAGDARWNQVAAEPAHERPTSRALRGAERIGLDAALAGARLDRLRASRSIDLAVLGAADAADAPYWIYVRHADHESPSTIESILVDAYSGAELHREGWRDRSAIGKVDQARYSLHVGAILGLPGRIAACLASLILAALCVTGPWMWWKRRPKGKLGVPPAARAPWWIYGIVAALGWLLPTVGATLLAILAFELVRWGIGRAPRVAVLLVLAVPGIARADDDLSPEDRALLEQAEQVEIVDPSEGQQLRESARAVTVIDTKVARERTADMGEVLSRAQGIQVRRSGGLGSATRLSVNGLYDESIRTFVDGIPVELAGYATGIENVPVALVQRIDIHRGVVPIALGADALGGAIDLVTDPSWVNQAALSYQIGSFGTHRATAAARARDPESGAAIGLAAYFDRAENDYDIDVDVPNAQGQISRVRVPRFHDAYEASGFSGEVGIAKRGPLQRLLLRVYQGESDKELPHNLVMTVPYGEATMGELTRGAVLSVELARGPWRARIVAGGARRWLDFSDRAQVVYDWFGNAVRPRTRFGEVGEEAYQRIVEDSAFARLVGERALGERQVLRVAVAPTVTTRAGTGFLHDPAAGRDPLSARADLAQVVSGVEHELRALDGRLQSIAFAKHYLSVMDAEDVRYMAPFIPVSHTIQTVGFGELVRYQLSPRLIAKASYEWTTRLPSANEVFGDGALVHANHALEPERSHNLNAGGRLQLETLQLDVNAFGRLTDNLILQLYGERFSVYENVYAARILGVDAGATWVAPGEWASLEGAVTVQDIRNASSTGTFGAYEGDRLPNRPWLLGSLAGTLRKRGVFGTRDEVSLFANSRYVRAFYRGWESVGTAASKQVIPSQLVHGAGVTYALRTATPIVATFEVSNLLDARVFDFIFVQRPGRAFSLRLSVEL